MKGWQKRAQSYEDHFQKLTAKLSDPAIYSDQNLLRTISKEHAALKNVVEKFRRYQKLMVQQQEAEELISADDQELAELAQQELAVIKPEIEKLAREIPPLLLPRNPNDNKNALMEIRAGTGGEEAALFANDLFRMYTRYSEKRGWKTELMSLNDTGIGGIKEVVFLIEGQDVYGQLKYESGVHRVQRIPVTESGGRIHTSAATVAVLPEVEEVDIDIDANDLKVDTFRSSGPGGQSVNTTDSAVRITHLPSGLTVSCQDEKSQHKNKAKALKILRARLQDKMQSEQQKEQDEARKVQVGSGDRSERIRTYNFPQGRITDHRINLTLYKLDEVLSGEVDELITALIEADQKARMEKVASVG